MDRSYQENIIEEATKFANSEIRPHATEFDANEAIPQDLIDKLALKGYLAATFPKKYGGLELDPVHYGLFTEEIGKACCSTRSLITVHTSLVGESILRWGTEDQKNKWIQLMAAGKVISAFGLTEPDIGTDARNIQTIYIKSGNKYIINGKKKWITFGDRADLFLIVARNDNEISTFLVERNNGVKSNRISGLLASRAAYIAEIELENVEIPEENLLGKEGNGFTYVVNTALDHGRYSIAWSGVAIAQAALEEMVSYSRKRKQFGQKLHNFQFIQGMIGDAITKIHAARALCLKAGEMRMNMHQDAIMETTIAKYYSSKIAMDITIDAVQVHGGNGCCNKYPVERLFREAKILEIIEGTSQIQQEIISSYGLRKYYKK